MGLWNLLGRLETGYTESFSWSSDNTVLASTYNDADLFGTATKKYGAGSYAKPVIAMDGRARTSPTPGPT